MNIPQDNRCPSPSSKKRKIDDDDNPASLETRKYALSGDHNKRPYGPLAMEPCSVNRLEYHISLLQSEIEGYREIIDTKLAEIEHAKYRVEYLKTKKEISVFKQRVKNAISEAFDANAATATERLAIPTSFYLESSLHEIKEEIMGEIDNVNFKGDSEHNTSAPELVAKIDAKEKTVHVSGDNELFHKGAAASIPESFVFPTRPTRMNGWRNWLLGSIHVEGDKRCMIKPYRLIVGKELPSKELKAAYKLNWKPIFGKMMEAPGVIIPPNYEDIDEDFVQTSFAIATKHLKEQYSYIFKTPENKRDLWSLSTWSKKVQPNGVRKNGTPEDIEKLPPSTVVKKSKQE